MAIPFLKKKPPAAGKGMVPLDRAKELTSKGFSEIEAIDILRKEGYSAEEIDRALTQAVKFGVAAQTPSAQPIQQSEERLPTLEEIAPTPVKIQMPEMPETSLPQEYYQQQSYPTEEYIDYVVRERTSDVDQKINEISIKTRDLDERIVNIQDRISEISKGKGSEEARILNRIDNFKETATDMNIRLGSMEKAFKETLPALIESVRALSDVVQRLKREA